MKFYQLKESLEKEVGGHIDTSFWNNLISGWVRYHFSVSEEDFQSLIKHFRSLDPKEEREHW